MNYWKVIPPLLLLTLQSSGFQINLEVSADASSITYTWQPQNTCGTITIDSLCGAHNSSVTSSMSGGRYIIQLSDGILVNQMKESKKLECDIDTKCQSNPSLGTIAQNTLTLSLTNGNDLPVIVKSRASLEGRVTVRDIDPSHIASVTWSEFDSDGGITATATRTTGLATDTVTLPRSLTDSATATSSHSSRSIAGETLGETSPPSESSTSKKTPIGAITGGVVGGISLLIATGVIAYAFLHRRKRSVGLKTDHVDLLEGNIPKQSVQAGFEPAGKRLGKRGRLAGVIQEKEEARRQQSILQADIQSQHTAEPHLNEHVSTEREAQLLQQVQALAERISDLERQQRELEDRLADEEAPPDYATTS